MADFETTRWSQVRLAADLADAGSEPAWAFLAERYWLPLYGYARRSGIDEESARDLTQSFFGHLVSSDLVARASPKLGRFRSLLLASFKNFIRMDGRKRQALKRGAGAASVSWEALGAEQRYLLEPAHIESPDKLFERRWALQIIEGALDRLEAEVAARAKPRLFEALKRFLLEDDGETCAGIASEFGMSEGAVKAAVHRLRQRYRALVREEIASTVKDPALIEDELRHVMAALQGG